MRDHKLQGFCSRILGSLVLQSFEELCGDPHEICIALGKIGSPSLGHRQVIRLWRRTIVGGRLFPGSSQRPKRREVEWHGENMGHISSFNSTSSWGKMAHDRKTWQMRRTVLTIEDFRRAERQKPVQIWTSSTSCRDPQQLTATELAAVAPSIPSGPI